MYYGGDYNPEQWPATEWPRHATATASPPPWAAEQYPQMLPQRADGTTLWPGSRLHYAVTSPEYRRLAYELASRVAQRYAHLPAVVMWHVNNENGCHVRYDYSDNARDAFRPAVSCSSRASPTSSTSVTRSETAGS